MRARPGAEGAQRSLRPHRRRGREVLAQSLRAYGAGRGVLIDREGRIIAGHKTVEEAKRLGIPLRVIRRDGQHLIAVERDDLDVVIALNCQSASRGFNKASIRTVMSA